MKKPRFSKEQIEELYIVKNLTREEVCETLHCSLRCFNRHRDFYNIEKKEEAIKSSRERRCEAKWGVKHQNQSPEMKELLRQKNLEAYATGEPQKKIRQTFQNNWGVDNPNKVKEVRDKITQTNLKRYGSTAPAGNREIIQKIKKGLEKSFATGEPQQKHKQTCLEKYGVDSYSKTEEYREKVQQAYATGEPQNKCHETKQRNGTLYQGGTSQREDRVYELLLTKFSPGDVIRQYRSKLYPFNCDFYIKSLDLFIEFQGAHYHYKEPYNSGNPEHIKRLNHLKQKEFEHKSIQKTQYTRMIKVWVEEDPLKRRIAKENNLNWKEFFTLEEVKNFIESL